MGGPGTRTGRVAGVTASLTLVRLRPDLPALVRAAARRGFLPPGGDPGYALHAALSALFGSAAPRPFALRETRGGPELIAYARAPADEVLALAALPPVGEARDLAEALLGGPPEARAMPSAWRAGQRLGFSLRARPVVRTRPQGRDGPHREHDLFAHLRCRACDPAVLPTREAAYREWLGRALERIGAATLEEARLVAYRSVKVLRRPFRGDGRASVVIEGPDATLEGILRIGEPSAFAALLARGIGRHAAFGFGMLLLSPPGRGPC